MLKYLKDLRMWSEYVYENHAVEKVTVDSSIRKIGVNIDYGKLENTGDLTVIDVPLTLSAAYRSVELALGVDYIGIEEIKELAKEKNVLEYQEISDFFKDSPLEVDQMEKVFDFLEASGVDVLRITENSGDELLLDNDMDMDGMEDEEEVELDKIDLSVPEGVSIEDPSVCT